MLYEVITESDGDGTFGSASSISTTYTLSAAELLEIENNGSVVVVLTAYTDANVECSAASDELVVTVYDNPEITADDDITICETELVDGGVSISATLGSGEGSVSYNFV